MTDHTELNSMVDSFFAAFVSGPEVSVRMQELRELFHPTARIIKTCGDEPVAATVDEFIAPREELLSSGSLTDFSEWPTGGRIDIFGDVAHWFGSYAKKGVQAGAPFTGRGMKSIQFVRTGAGWRITAAAWDDERPGGSGVGRVAASGLLGGPAGEE